MLVKEHVSDSYPIVDAYAGVRDVSNQLLENGFLVVFNNDKYLGILTPHDVLSRPHKLVIDCLSNNNTRGLNASDVLEVALNRLNQVNTAALPVYDGSRYQGIIRKDSLFDILRGQIADIQQKLSITQGFKSEFLKNLVHEIRTPLNGILPFIELLSTLNTEEIAEHSEYIYSQLKNSTDRFLEAINDLIDLSRIESGEMIKLKIEKADLPEVFKNTAAHVRKLEDITDRTIAVEDYLYDAGVVLRTDVQKLQRVLKHLVSCAAKSCAVESNIRFGLDRLDKDKAVFTIAYTDSQAELEQDLYKALSEKAGASDHDRMGIGLSISKKLIELLGGTIHAIKKPGKKTVIQFTVSPCLED